MKNIPSLPKNKLIRSLLIVIALVVGSTATGTAYAFMSSPAVIRTPAFEHLHFRMQVINGGKPVDFGSKQFQEGYSKDNCNADLTKNPIHFHDEKDQFVHIHWKDITGGMVLKYYGWNHIGGPDGLMGYRTDMMPNLVTVPFHGQSLPRAASDNFYIYVGDEHGYKQKSFDAFLHQNIESFLGKQSNVQSPEITWLDRLFPTASAHGGEHPDEHVDGEAKLSDEDLKRLNNLIGNVVIFVQDKAPTADQIKTRFNDLEPLSASACAG